MLTAIAWDTIITPVIIPEAQLLLKRPECLGVQFIIYRAESDDYRSFGSTPNPLLYELFVGLGALAAISLLALIGALLRWLLGIRAGYFTCSLP